MIANLIGATILSLTIQSTATEFTDYAEYSKPHPAVNVIINKGIVHEMIITCKDSDIEGMVTYDVAAKEYVDAQHKIHKTLDAAINGSCMQL